MIKYNPKELLTTEQFVREPIDNISKTLNENSSKRIILNGGRGSGKSTILYSMQDKTVGTSDPIIYTHFDSVINFSTAPNNIFDEIFFEHYYELCFSWKLLSFIEKNYSLIYEKYFKDIELLLKTMLEELDKNIKNATYNGISLDRHLFATEISSEILKKLKKIKDFPSFNLAIDRFDWVNGKSEFTQQLLSKYFELFDKTIITSDDENLDDKNKIKEFEKKGYSVISADYGKDLDVVKCIIKKRIELYNERKNTRFDIDSISNEIYTNLIDKTDGNLSAMLDSTNAVVDLFKWYDGNVDVTCLFDVATEKSLNEIKQLKKISSPPRLYL